MKTEHEILTDHEVQALIMAYLNGSAPQAVEEGELRRLLDWAVEVRVEAAILSQLIAGKITVRRDDEGEWVYQKVDS